MYEFELMNVNTKERIIIWGRNGKDAFRRNPDLDVNEWKVMHQTYID